MKVATRGTDAVVIYRDEPETVGVGLMGGMLDRHIEVLIDHQYQFQKDRMDIPHQLFPLDATSAFTCEGGHWSADFKRWEYTPRESAGWRLVDGQLTMIDDVQKLAAREYRLAPDERFLGLIDNRVFYWRSFNPSRVFWRKLGNDAVYSVGMPRGVIDLYGATRGIRKDIGFVVFRRSPGFLVYSPYTDDFVEISLKDGVARHAP